jgi:hypothetical protein
LLSGSYDDAKRNAEGKASTEYEKKEKADGAKKKIEL